MEYYVVVRYLLVFIFLLFNIYSIYSVDELNNGYKDIKLGMRREEVEIFLQKSLEFNFRTEEILTIRIEPDKEIINTEGRGFIINGYFHFDHDQLYQILLKISEKKIGYYTLLTGLTKKYGEPTSFSPEKAIWEDNRTRIILEKPCTIKYIDLHVWNGMIEQKEKPDNIDEKIRESFIDSF